MGKEEKYEFWVDGCTVGRVGQGDSMGKPIQLFPRAMVVALHGSMSFWLFFSFCKEHAPLLLAL